MGQIQFSAMSALHSFACDETRSNNDAWGVNNLYDCQTRTLYIPYQLWTGAHWNGDKTAACMHDVNSLFEVNGDSKTTIVGPVVWVSPRPGKDVQVWIRDKVDGSKSQYFTCHEKGIGRIYDSRRPRFYLTGRCKFPAGAGWALAKRRFCNNTSIQITEMVFDLDGYLLNIKFKWWHADIFDHIYRYMPDVGMTHAWKQ